MLQLLSTLALSPSLYSTNNWNPLVSSGASNLQIKWPENNVVKRNVIVPFHSKNPNSWWAHIAFGALWYSWTFIPTSSMIYSFCMHHSIDRHHEDCWRSMNDEKNTKRRPSVFIEDDSETGNRRQQRTVRPTQKVIEAMELNQATSKSIPLPARTSNPTERQVYDAGDNIAKKILSFCGFSTNSTHTARLYRN